MPDSVQLSAATSSFVSKEAAKQFLAQALPAATAANPKFRSGTEGVLQAWIIKSVEFRDGEGSNDLLLSMSEVALEFRNGVRTHTGSDEVEFSLGAVAISERRDPGTISEAGEVSMAVMFQCNAGNCIRKAKDGKATTTDWIDVSIQDNAARAKILEAFQMLKAPGS